MPMAKKKQDSPFTGHWRIVRELTSNELQWSAHRSVKLKCDPAAA
jgi:hypothetical protein